MGNLVNLRCSYTPLKRSLHDVTREVDRLRGIGKNDDVLDIIGYNVAVCVSLLKDI